MSLHDMLFKNLGLKALSLLLAVVLWLFVTLEKESEVDVTVPVILKNLSPGLAVAGKPPSRIDVRIAGSKILMLRMRPDRITVPLDLKGVNEGTVVFSALERALRLSPGVRVIRVYPSTIELKLVKSR
ncbi:MAG: hypothetical protein FD174_1452 [Geobacteraceae bacterium]|nr:MAG: hypothetical protein FD174_1452 [Geobacteraceae bacterium]